MAGTAVGGDAEVSSGEVAALPELYVILVGGGGWGVAVNK